MMLMKKHGFILPWNFAQASAKKADDLSQVQPPDAENRMSSGVEGLRGEIPVSPSDQKETHYSLE